LARPHNRQVYDAERGRESSPQSARDARSSKSALDSRGCRERWPPIPGTRFTRGLATIHGRKVNRQAAATQGRDRTKSGDSAAERYHSKTSKKRARQDAGPTKNQDHHHGAWNRHRKDDFDSRQTSLSQNYSEDRRRPCRQPHPHTAAHVFLSAKLRELIERGTHLHRAAPLYRLRAEKWDRYTATTRFMRRKDPPRQGRTIA